MFRFLNLLTAFAIPLLSLADAIVFENISLQKAKEKAAKENKIIFLDAYATWCGPCKKMERYVFTDTDVATFYNKHFINLRIDMESKEGIPIAKKYGVEAYPTFLFINANGELVKSQSGYMEPDQFIKLGKRVAIPGFSPLKEFEEKYSKGERGGDFMYDYISELKDENKDYEIIGQNYLDSIHQIESIYQNEKDFVIFYLCEERIGSRAVTYFKNNIAQFYFSYPAEYVKKKITNLIEGNILALKDGKANPTLAEEIMVFCKATVPDDIAAKYGKMIRGE